VPRGGIQRVSQINALRLRGSLNFFVDLRGFSSRVIHARSKLQSAVHGCLARSAGIRPPIDTDANVASAMATPAPVLLGFRSSRL
jgi:hypothetical protein